MGVSAIVRFLILAVAGPAITRVVLLAPGVKGHAYLLGPTSRQVWYGPAFQGWWVNTLVQLRVRSMVLIVSSLAYACACEQRVYKIVGSQQLLPRAIIIDWWHEPLKMVIDCDLSGRRSPRGCACCHLAWVSIVFDTTLSIGYCSQSFSIEPGRTSTLMCLLCIYDAVYWVLTWPVHNIASMIGAYHITTAPRCCSLYAVCLPCLALQVISSMKAYLNSVKISRFQQENCIRREM